MYIQYKYRSFASGYPGLLPGLAYLFFFTSLTEKIKCICLRKSWCPLNLSYAEHMLSMLAYLQEQNKSHSGSMNGNNNPLEDLLTELAVREATCECK